MNRKLPWIVLLLSATLHAAEPQVATPLQPAATQAEAAALSARLLGRFHYQPTPLDDALSARILDRYLKALDPERVYFVQADIERYAAARTTLDDAIREQDLRLPFEIFALYQTRLRERLALARELAAGSFDFSTDEQYRFVRTDEPWPANEAAARELWRKRVKNDWLRLKLAGKDDKGIRDTLTKRYDSLLTRATRIKSEDVFQTFMNAYATSIEPHTNYLGPRASEDFEISMRLSLVGIGAVLQERDDYIVIRELVPGGPAARSTQLAIGDRILGVGQGEQPPVEVLGWRVDDVVALIRGNKDTVVVLDVLPAEAGPDGAHKKVKLVRDTINLEKQAASKSVIDAGPPEAPRKVGVITLPAFYQDVAARGAGGDYRSASRDVARLLRELKAEGADAVLIDLRNNGGGSLDEAVRLTGLFIDTGPVVQQRSAQGQIRVERDTDAGQVWDGPLGVLINRASASASEIFAGAIQDYGRGVLIGEQSFGKGTVQTLVDLDEMARNSKPIYGELKMTIAQFYRVNGESTQLRGVSPDIGLPSLLDADRFGESGFDNALPWTRIDPAPHKAAGGIPALVPTLQQRHLARIANDAAFRNLQQDVTEVAAQRKKLDISLNEAERRRERAEQERKLRANANANAADEDNGDDGLLAGERSLDAELAAEQLRKKAPDVLLNEAARIVGDLATLQRSEANVAAGGRRSLN
ncbi:tail-specific penicillin-binding protein protease [Azoarcus olearius]|uniref:carboxy terminal-processing peptidase n=1 Tax=Azoarcus sp. (strain BH72) TaxID=418699 RepID=UPI00080634DD|nr:carboxy terminal-processing peptidase [Azoarcus olearius]ANQ85498.1 tail-specific penicillin-binding protein protease [Azoarcus olearius]